MTYSEKLLDPRWQKKRLQILKRDKFTCKLCGDKETTLHVHHKSYNVDPWKVKNTELITYCKDCHSIVEYIKNGGFPFLSSLIISNIFKIITGNYCFYYALGFIENNFFGLILYEQHIDTNIIEFLGIVPADILDKIKKHNNAEQNVKRLD